MGRGPIASDCSWPLVSAAEFFAAGGKPGAALAQGPPGREAAVPILEYGDDNVLREPNGKGARAATGGTDGISELVFVPDRCGCRLCSQCGQILGRKLRKRLHEKVKLFPAPRMLTLTVDLKGTITGKGFDSPEAAHAYVMAGRYIPKLMAKLGIRVWVWVLEFQRNGNPHWHVVFDSSELKDQRFDYREVWRLWRDLWKIGGCTASSKADAFDSPEHALNYVTKYIIKEPEAGYPDWVWDAGRRAVRFVGASKAVGRLVRADSAADVDHDDQVDAEEESEQVEASASVPVTYRERVGRCRSSVKALRHRVEADGTESWEWVGGLAVRWETWVLMTAAGVIAGVKIGDVPVLNQSGEDTGERRMVLKARPFLHVADLERQVKRGLTMGHGYLLELAATKGFEFMLDGSWTWKPPAERVA